jgi:hypothetical protein
MNPSTSRKKKKKISYYDDHNFINTIFSWSLQDIFNQDLYKDQVGFTFTKHCCIYFLRKGKVTNFLCSVFLLSPTCHLIQWEGKSCKLLYCIVCVCVCECDTTKTRFHLSFLTLSHTLSFYFLLHFNKII